MHVTSSSVNATKERDTRTIQSIASAFNLSVTAFGEQLTDPDAPSFGSVILDNHGKISLDPSPATPWSGDDAGPFRLVAGTIKSVYRAHRNFTGDENVLVAPGIVPGVTGTPVELLRVQYSCCLQIPVTICLCRHTSSVIVIRGREVTLGQIAMLMVLTNVSHLALLPCVYLLTFRRQVCG